MRGFHERTVGEVEQDEDHDEHDGEHQLQPLPGSRLVLPPAAPLDVVASRQRHRASDGRARLLDEAADVAVLDVQQHRCQQEAVLGRDHGRAARGRDAGDLAERHLHAARAGDEHRSEGLRIRAIRVRIAHAHRKALPAFDGRGQRRFADGVRNHVLDVTDADAIACGGRPVDLDVQVLAAGHLLRIDVAGARDPPDHVRDLPRQAFERPEIGAEQLHADLRADAGRQHVDAVDDRHRPDGRDSRELDRPAHLGAQRVQRQTRSPLRARLQPHDRLGHVQRRRVGGRLGAGDLGDDVATSGTLRSAASCVCAMRVFSSIEMLGSAIGMNIRSPSFRAGINSLPMPRARSSAPASRRPAAPSVSCAMRECRVENRAVKAPQAAHHRVAFSG